MVQYHLPVNQQLPGESQTAFGTRTGTASAQNPLNPSGQSGIPPVPPVTGQPSVPTGTGNP